MAAAIGGSSASGKDLMRSVWINPDHITHLVPVTVQGEFAVELLADYKLQGLSEGRWHLGHYPDRKSAEAAAAEFIEYLSRHSHDPHQQ